LRRLPAPAARLPSPLKSLADFLWTLVRWSLPLTVAGVVAAVAIGSSRVGEEVRRRIEARLRAEFPALSIVVQSATLIEGEGIVVRGASFVDPTLPGDQRRLLGIDEIRIACGTTLQELAGGTPRITAVTLRRPTLHASRGADGHWSPAVLLRSRPGGLQVPVTVEDATLIVDDPTRQSRITLRNIGAEVRPAANAALDVRGSISGDFFDRAGFAGRVTSGEAAFDLNGRIEGLDLSPRLRAMLPAASGPAAALAGLRGRVDLERRVGRLPGRPRRPGM
jgi:hypothetical protein